MASRDIVVSVGDDDWLTLSDAAECAGMSVAAYVAWGVRVLAFQARPGGSKRRPSTSPSATRRRAKSADETESMAWAETFSERLSHRADRYRGPAVGFDER
ncbi:hypothetical protein [Nocardia sp. CA-145437]|uniref:hypothetical protein n=1 Tax=Nocardia sp. CA-145437 TaxID=3239980 RepID=UPI003D994AAB